MGSRSDPNPPSRSDRLLLFRPCTMVSMQTRPSTARRVGELLGLVYPDDHPLRVDRRHRSRALALRVLALYASAAAMFWILYGVTLQPAAFFVAALLTFFAVMKVRAVT